jgi:UDP-N-acetylglucosamine:LPS N-acetylglucosamine transferase
VTRPPRVLIVSASVGEGHDLPARELAAGLRAESPGAHVAIVDGLAEMGSFVEGVIMGNSRYESEWENRLFDATYSLITHVPPTRSLMGQLSVLFGSRGLMRAINRERPDAIVSTYPGTSEILGRMRRWGRLSVPCVSAITDLAALRYWSHPGVDLHLITHPESEAEVASIAPGARIVPVRGLNSPAFLEPRDRAEARRALDLPAEPKLVVVSGGGWAVGDLPGGIEATLAVDGAHAVVLCGRDEELRAGLQGRFAHTGRVHALGFTDQMPDLLTAADALVHSTAGLTVLEALICGCPAISYGWGIGHIRANNRAFERFGLAEVAPDRPALEAALRRALAHRPEPLRESFAALPSAASEVLALAAGHQLAHGA